MFSPLLKRFVSMDPLGFNAGSMNLYETFGCDPVNNTDPMGTFIASSDYQGPMMTPWDITAPAGMDTANIQRWNDVEFKWFMGAYGGSVESIIASLGHVPSFEEVMALANAWESNPVKGLSTDKKSIYGPSYGMSDEELREYYNVEAGKLVLKAIYTPIAMLAMGLLETDLRVYDVGGGLAGLFSFGSYQHHFASFKAQDTIQQRQSGVSWSRINLDSWQQAGIEGAVFVGTMGACKYGSQFVSWLKNGSSTSGLYWHGSPAAVARRSAGGLFVDPQGNAGKYWATNIQGRSFLTRLLVGGNTNIKFKYPFYQSKGGLEATYQLSQSEASLFNRAWGPRFSWDPLDSWKGLMGQYYYQPTPVTMGQRFLELSRFIVKFGAAGGAAYALSSEQ
jgi:hypothetical protein